LVETLSKIAASNVSVVAVLHQPSARVFRLLQGVILMSRGSAVFQGEPQQVVPYLASQGFADAPGGSSARSEAEFIMDVLAGHEQGDVSGLASAWRRQALTSWPAIEAQMESYRQAEDAAFKRLSRPSRNPGLGTRLVEWTGLLVRGRAAARDSRRARRPAGPLQARRARGRPAVRRFLRHALPRAAQARSVRRRRPVACAAAGLTAAQACRSRCTCGSGRWCASRSAAAWGCTWACWAGWRAS
jgi:hypothetical protein